MFRYRCLFRMISSLFRFPSLTCLKRSTYALISDKHRVRVFFTITISDIRTFRKKVGHNASGCHSLTLYFICFIRLSFEILYLGNRLRYRDETKSILKCTLSFIPWHDWCLWFCNFSACIFWSKLPFNKNVLVFRRNLRNLFKVKRLG